MTAPELERLPPVDVVQGLYLGPDGYAQLQYKSGERIYEVRFSLNEVFRMEEFFIMLRRHLGATMRKDRP